MPYATSGGSLVTGANIVDQSVGPDDLSATALSDHLLDVLTLFPKPVLIPGTATDGVIAKNLQVNTSAKVGLFSVDKRITVNKVSVVETGGGLGGDVAIAVFSEDGQTRHINTTVTCDTAATIKTATLGTAVTLPAGNYFVVVLSISTADVGLAFYDALAGSVDALVADVSGKPRPSGTLTVTASTMPTTFSPGDIADDTTVCNCIALRLDN